MEDFWRALLNGLGDDSGGTALVTRALVISTVVLLLAVLFIEMF